MLLPFFKRCVVVMWLVFERSRAWDFDAGVPQGKEVWKFMVLYLPDEE
jgi:hypothetical protein